MSTLEQQTTKSKRTLWIVVVGGLAVLLIVGVVTALTIVKAQQPKPDQHAIAACTLLGQRHQSLLDGFLSEVKAIDEANKSSVPSLRKAARTVSPASKLPTDDPGYKNPGDVQATAIAKWCNQHRS